MTVPWHWLAPAFELAPRGPVLEVGTGRGDVALAWARHGRSVLAVDLDVAGITAKRPRRLHVRRADLRTLRPRESFYAAVHAHNVLQFLPAAELDQALRRLAAAVKPGGILALTAFSPKDPLAQAPGAEAMTFRTCDQLLAALDGFEVLFRFEGELLDEHPPDGVHRHGQAHLVLRRRGAEVGQPWAIPGPRPPERNFGVGLSVRPQFEAELFDRPGAVDAVELMTDSYLYPPHHRELEKWSARFPVFPHSVTLSVGTPLAPDDTFLAAVARAVSAAQVPWHSDHLCFAHVPEVETAALVPVAFSDEMVEVVARNARRIRELVPVPLLLENIAYYFRVPGGTMEEAEFIRKVVDRADVGLLLDVTNLALNARNNGYDAYAFVDALPLERVWQLHIAGGRPYRDVILDTHSEPVPAEVMKLMEYVLQRAPVRAVILERDVNVPPLGELLGEVEAARALFRRYRR
ncbi:MAG TPA: DUF692 family protein [Myxococcales bacterium]|nr:DUF692 family protein [Myxococcales bacterium]